MNYDWRALSRIQFMIGSRPDTQADLAMPSKKQVDVANLGKL